MINVVVGSHKRFEVAERVIQYSIKKNTSVETNIIIARPEYFGFPDSGCTGFSDIRYKVPDIARDADFAIYLDVDMIVLGDLAELYSYARPGRYVCMQDGSTEVGVVDCKICGRPNTPTYAAIPCEWNCEDYCATETEVANAKILHFTDLKNQPWDKVNPNKPMMDIWTQYEKDSKSV